MNVKDATVIRFKEILKERNIAINELATMSGVTPSTAYSMFDSSRRDISLITVKKFCDGLGITLEEFFNSKIFTELEPEIK
ncbi:Helix-turn-helix domain-containing protein [Pseudobutyrivibrio sp. NOR37]|uniref:Helix-turn-helix transcriptional regulator n=1 Tax=Pseudobutyrivibrio xylanivorans TaxID=185007 RepID=A0A6M0LL99_PSEXY|nr:MULTISPECIES: helix-turn-helix transcriptional regulator [Pseudobutyrivibrio]NEX02763.1 helix-turn-helix transcriptional regulator [Pseudobutyrivibrio xylanivorans]SFR80921.1 Helix-turn-helix domain-containing protein [Pseudobutyrivibrio sp. NOR37]